MSVLTFHTFFLILKICCCVHVCVGGQADGCVCVCVWFVFSSTLKGAWENGFAFSQWTTSNEPHICKYQPLDSVLVLISELYEKKNNQEYLKEIIIRT